MMESRQNICVNIVFLLGKIYNKDSVPFGCISRATDGRATVLATPWLPNGIISNDRDIIIKSDVDAAALGREISVATGWNDNPTYFVLADKLDLLAVSKTTRLQRYLAIMLESARVWGTNISYYFHQLHCLPSVAHGKNHLDTVARELNGKVGQSIPHNSHAEIEIFVRNNSNLCLLLERAYEACLSMGATISNHSLADSYLLSYLQELDSRGISVDPSRDELTLKLSTLLAKKLLA